MHKESIDEARRRLLEYQEKLKQRYPGASAALLNPAQKLAPSSSVPESPLQSQGSGALQRINLSSYQPSKSTSVQDFPEPVGCPWLLKEPPEQRNKEQMFEVGSGRQAQPVCSQVENIPQLSQASYPHQQTAKLVIEGLRAPQSLEFQDISGSQDISVTNQSTARMQQVRFILPSDHSSESSETSCPDKSTSPAPPEKNQPPTSLLKQQELPTERRMRASDSACLPQFQSLSSVSSSVDRETGRTQESVAIKNVPFSSSDIMELKGRVLASSESIQAQQAHLRELQEQLDAQRETLLSRQRTQEELLMQKHTQLKRQMEQQQEALKDILKRVCLLGARQGGLPATLQFSSGWVPLSFLSY